jgi:asparagine synthase (glutamine-hydrolysing)
MCGILGKFIVDPMSDLQARIDMSITQLKHRGPDDQGVEVRDVTGGTLVLGHTRLSIIDLSTAGHQPMHTNDGKFTLVFNGEIYNYLELREELKALGYVFQTKTDTEVLLIAWSHWKEKCLSKLNGMFAFAIWDHADQSVTLVRDPFGIKPLFYSISCVGAVTTICQRRFMKMYCIYCQVIGFVCHLPNTTNHNRSAGVGQELRRERI